MKITLSISQSMDTHFRRACQEQLVDYICVKEAYYARPNEIYQDYEINFEKPSDLYYLGISIGIKSSLESSLRIINSMNS